MKEPMQDKDWQAECDLRTLIDAEKIKKDKARHSAALKKHAEMMADMENIKKES
jgi:hypothetical protein